MTNQDFALKSRSGQQIALQGIHVAGRLDGLNLTAKLRQTYRNDTGYHLETVYTFPLAWGAILLGLKVEIAGRQLQGAVIEKKQATQRYEQAIDAGDTPVMVERSAAGLYTANLGNLKPGEEASIEIEYAQLLCFEQGRVRLHIPTTVGQRYGDAHAQGGLAPHETDRVNPLVEYPFSLELTLAGVVAQARLSSPSHGIETARNDEGVTVRLDRGGWLDRDFILNLDGLEGQSFALACQDGEQTTVLASFCPQLEAQKAVPVALKILVDCSGSMQGDSIAQARRALHEVAQSLRPTDWVSYSKFGDRVSHAMARLEPCTPAMVSKVLSKAIGGTEADMGGTELHRALMATLAIRPAKDEMASNNVLLITDGDVWDIENIVAEARQCQHRIFAVGVGSAPAESLLRQLAEQTGGACELVAPNENMAEAILRMFHRMREGRLLDLEVDWGGEAAWQSTPPRYIVPGETVHLFATLQLRPQQAQLRPPVMRFHGQDQAAEIQAEAISMCDDSAIARLAGAQRLMQTSDQHEALSLALRYQLVSERTSLFLVHERAKEDKAQGLPQLQQIEHMVAAGWGGFGSVAEAEVPSFCRSGIDNSIRWSTNRTPAAAMSNAMLSTGMDDHEIPAFLRKQSNEASASGLTPAELVDVFNRAALQAATFGEALQDVLARDLDAGLVEALDEVARTLGSHRTAWALLLEWLAMALPKDCPLSRHGERLIRVELATNRELEVRVARERFAAAFPGLAAERWKPVAPDLFGSVSQWQRKALNC